MVTDPCIPEQTASLHLSMGEGGVIFRRFGGDEAQGGAVDLVRRCLNMNPGQAAQWLIDQAGGWQERSDVSRSPVPVRSAGGKRLDRASRTADEMEKVKRTWQRLTVGSDGPAHAEVDRRGLLPALESGLLRAYTTGSWQGRNFARGALGFEIIGPAGDTLALRVRNLGTKEAKYRYVFGGKGSPPWCNPAFFQVGEARSSQEIWVEGELSGIAVALALAQAGYGSVRVQGVAGASATPHLEHLQGGDAVYLYADPDASGNQARRKWASAAAARGVRVRQLPNDLFSEGDACDTLKKMGAAVMGSKVMQAVKGSEQGFEDVWVDASFRYGVRQGRICKLTQIRNSQDQLEDKQHTMTNFVAWIEQEVEVVNGSARPERVFHLAALLPGRTQAVRVEVKAAEFSSMNWVVEELGSEATLFPGPRHKDEVRAAIQLLSKERGIERVTRYRHTGWVREGGRWYFLTAQAVIGAEGETRRFEVELPDRLAAFALPAPDSRPEAAREALRASLSLLALVPDKVGVALLAAAYLAPLGRSKLTVWMVGLTGTNKTSFMALVQSHFGKGWTRDYLPESWHGSANGLEHIAFLAKDVLLVIDDFKPQGGKRDQDDMHAKAARIIQGVADGQGRTTMTAERETRAAYYPRGTVVSSAEELPRGHSNRARMFSVQVDRPLIGQQKERSAQFYAAEDLAAAGVYAQAMAGYVQFLADRLDRLMVGSETQQAHLRHYGQLFRGEHGRTSHNPAELSYGWRVMLSYALSTGAVTLEKAQALWQRGLTALSAVALEQDGLLRQVDPARQAVTFIAEWLRQGSVYLNLPDQLPDGLSPAGLGWEIQGDGKLAHQPFARNLGWMEDVDGRLWANFLPEVLYSELQQFCSRQSGSLPGKAALWSAMRSHFQRPGLMRCSSDRPTYRARAEDGSRPWVISLRFPFDPSMNEPEADQSDRQSEVLNSPFEPLV